jgi:hypothetical protein
MGFEDLFVNSGSGREFHPGFFFIAGDGEGSACGRDSRRRRWRRRSCFGLLCNSFFCQGVLFKGMDVKIL